MTRPGEIQALLFDMGDVVIDIDFDRATRCWKKRTFRTTGS